MIDPQPGDEGRLVIYTDGQGEREAGTISSWNPEYVFVRYGRIASGPAATRREQLEWGTERA